MVEFTSDYGRADDGPVDISRSRIEFVERLSDSANCAVDFQSGHGTFEFDVAGEQPARSAYGRSARASAV